MQCFSHFHRGVPPQVLVTSGTIAVIKMTESQIKWVYFELKFSQTEEAVSQELLRESSGPMSALGQTNNCRNGDVHPLKRNLSVFGLFRNK